MINVFNALDAAFPSSVAVSRAWPQSDKSLPSVTFRVKSWEKQADGSAILTLALLLSVSSPQQGDTFTTTATNALTPLGYSLAFGEDAVDQATGTFLRRLEYAGLFNAPPAAPQLEFLVRHTDTSWYSVGLLRSLRLLPAVRTATWQQGTPPDPSGWVLDDPSPRFTVVEAGYNKNDPGQLVLIDAFRANRAPFHTNIAAAGVHLPPHYLMSVVTELSYSAMGFYAKLLVTSNI